GIPASPATSSAQRAWCVVSKVKSVSGIRLDASRPCLPPGRAVLSGAPSRPETLANHEPSVSFPPVAEQMDVIRRDAVEIVPEEELVRKLERSLATGEPLRVKQG